MISGGDPNVASSGGLPKEDPSLILARDRVVLAILHVHVSTAKGLR